MLTRSILNYISTLVKLNSFTRNEAIGLIIEEGRGTICERITLFLEDRDIEPWELTQGQINRISRVLGETPESIREGLKEMSRA